MEKEEKAVLEAVMNMTKALQNKKTQEVMKAYENQATVVFQPTIPSTERPQIQSNFEEIYELNPQFSYSGHEVIVEGNIAIHIAPWDMTGSLPDGSEIKQSGLSVAILRKQTDGTWKMIIDHPHAQHLMQHSSQN